MIDKKEIARECKFYGIRNFVVQDNGEVDVVGDVMLGYAIRHLDHIPIRFGWVTGNFSAAHCPIKSLYGAPRIVGKDFACNDTDITSLIYSPVEIGGDFYASFTKIDITKWIGLQAPSYKIGGYFECFSHDYSINFPKESLERLFKLGFHDFELKSDQNIEAMYRKYKIDQIIQHGS